jgi:hypothetical protein
VPAATAIEPVTPDPDRERDTMEDLKKKPGIVSWAPVVIAVALLVMLVAWALKFPW